LQLTCNTTSFEKIHAMEGSVQAVTLFRPLGVSHYRPPTNLIKWQNNRNLQEQNIS